MVQPASNRLLVEAQRGAANGLASLDGTGKLPDAQVPTRLGTTQLNATFVQKSKVKTDGTDQTSVMQAEINSLQTFGGGEIVYPPGTIRIDGRITPSYTLDGTGAPIQATLKLTGTGKMAHGRGSGIPLTPTGGTQFDMRWSDADLKKAKFHSKGFGYLEITGITFVDKGATPSLNPFIKHTNTTVNIHDVAAIGHTSLSGVNCTQDFIVGGGHTMPAPGGDFSLDDDSPFQGYGSEYKNIWHNHIRRAVVLGAYANQAKVDGVYGWQDSGNANGGSVEIDPGLTAGQGVNGVSLSNILAESLHYKYGVYLRKLSRSTLTNIGSYDYAGNSTYTAAIGLHSCDGLTIIAGYDDLDGIKSYVATVPGSATANWRDMATLIHSSLAPNSPGTSFAAKLTAWNGLTIRPYLGGASASLLFARAAEATTGPQAGFANYGTKWQTDGTGGGMSIDTGTGGSYLDLKAYGVRYYSQTGALMGTFGAGKNGFTLGTTGDVSIERHATGIVKSNGRLRGDGGLSTALAAEPVAGTIDNGECVFWLDGTPGATKLKIIAKDSGGTVRRGEIALT